MKKYIALITLLTLIEGPLQAEHDYWTTFGEGMLIGVVMYWQVARTWSQENSKEKEIDPHTTLPCGHEYVCPACQIKNDRIAQENIRNGKKDYKKFARNPLKRVGQRSAD